LFYSPIILGSYRHIIGQWSFWTQAFQAICCTYIDNQILNNQWKIYNKNTKTNPNANKMTTVKTAKTHKLACTR